MSLGASQKRKQSGAKFGSGTSASVCRIVLDPVLDSAAAAALHRKCARLLKKGKSLHLSMEKVTYLGSAGAAVLAELEESANEAGLGFALEMISPRVGQVLGQMGRTGGGEVSEGSSSGGAGGGSLGAQSLVAVVEPADVTAPASTPASANTILAVGEAGYRFGQSFLRTLYFISDTMYAALVEPFARRFPPKGSVSSQMLRIGADAVPILGLLSFLVGLIMAFQGAYQLRQFGANIFLANLVGLSIVRELGPLLTAIIVAGRSGSAMAAEIGTMKVQEEMDALVTMGIEPIRFLVVPRLWAIAVVGPLLTMLSNLLGIIGGFLIGVFYLDLSAESYWAQTLSAISAGDLLNGLAKSLVFSLLIGSIGCSKGYFLKGGADAVGRATTSAVVSSLFAIIVADSLITTLNTLM